MKKIFGAVAVLLVWLYATLSANAQIASTLSSAFNPSSGGAVGQSDSIYRQGASFITGNDALTMTSIVVRLKTFSGAPTVGMELRSHDIQTNAPYVRNANTTNEGLITGFSQIATTTSTYADYTFTPDAPVSLERNTQYWITLFRTNNDGLARWAYESVATPAEGAATVPDIFSF